MTCGPPIGADLPGQPATIRILNPSALPLLREADEAIVGPWNLFPLLMAGQVVALMVMLAWFRRSTGLERLQYRRLGSAAAVVVLGTVRPVSLSLWIRPRAPGTGARRL